MQNPLISALKVPSFSFLLISEFFSQFAMNLLNFILLIVVFQLSSSNLAVAGVILAFTLPSILFGILAGVLVDRWNKKRVLVYTNILRAAAAFPLILISNELFFIYFLTFLVSLITQFFVPAETPIIPQLVPKYLLLPANALFSMGIFGSIIVAYALSGPFLLIFGSTNIFIFVTFLFIAASVFALLIKFKNPNNGSNQGRIEIFKEVRDAFTLMAKKEKIYHSLFILTLLQTLILVIAVIGPGYATNILKIQVEKFPLLFVTPAVVGMGIGAIIIGNFLHQKSKQTLVKFGLLITGLMVLAFPHGGLITSREFIHQVNQNLPNVLSINDVHIMMIIAIIVGFAFSLVFVPSNTMIQEETTDRQRGKIYGTLNTFVGAVSIAPVLGVGIVADLFGVGRVLTLIGMIIILASVLLFWKYK
ncbi:MAG: MFS transporter [Candidatus Levybacteria bacterium]|nr:MFS transporter [Candidatus Levybacteria bacterium]